MWHVFGNGPFGASASCAMAFGRQAVLRWVLLNVCLQPGFNYTAMLAWVKSRTVCGKLFALMLSVDALALSFRLIPPRPPLVSFSRSCLPCLHSHTTQAVLFNHYTSFVCAFVPLQPASLLGVTVRPVPVSKGVNYDKRAVGLVVWTRGINIAH